MSRESIWFGLGRFGLAPEEKAVIMGNAQQESGNETDRVQGDFDRDRCFSKEYTAMVDKGAVGRTEFINRGPNGGGYGWLQWTFWSRKAGLYDLAKGRGVSIGDEDLALDYMWQELNTAEFSSVLQMLRSDASLREKVVYWMIYFEKPDDKSIKAQNIRVRYAEQILAEFAEKTAPETPGEQSPVSTDNSDEKDDKKPKCKYHFTEYAVKIHLLKKGDYGPEVTSMQSLLNNRKFNCGEADGYFGPDTEKALINFQKANGLTPDGEFGGESFKALWNM